ncbi:hypothetical protein ADIS_2030 [Lunatimonas lonarensis]|uniref:Wzy n=1 Tax=Lunatimonas lonarensis TaxID=1232681 RepID=R7ZTQ0_9BACT|nr:EpsG family protein [Lunatimonas lonarensis]EON77500.1 hypothetical protein ADIS_2030 [Lunatimonas lonarensis]
MVNDYTGKQALFFSLSVVSISILINPLFVFFTLLFSQVIFRDCNPVYVFFSILFLTCIFFFREFGVDWTANSTDDSIEYIARYHKLSEVSFFELFSRFFDRLGDLEPLWYLPWWILKKWFNGSTELFLFFQYLLSSCLLVYLLIKLERTFFLILLTFYLFVFPDGVYSFVHLFRAQIAFLIFSVGLVYFQENRKVGFFLMFISGFFQIISFFYAFVFLAFYLFNRDFNRIKVVVFCFICMFLFPFVFQFFLYFLSEYVGFVKILNYLQIDGSLRFSFYIKSVLIFLFLFIYTIFGSGNKFVFASLILNFVSVSFFVAIPNAAIIYERLFIFTLPLLSISFALFLIEFFSKRSIYILSVLLVCLAFVRIYVSSKYESGVYQYLAFGDLLSPFSGFYSWIFLQ